LREAVCTENSNPHIMVMKSRVVKKLKL
jgi:hypothetical protein